MYRRRPGSGTVVRKGATARWHRGGGLAIERHRLNQAESGCDLEYIRLVVQAVVYSTVVSSLRVWTDTISTSSTEPHSKLEATAPHPTLTSSFFVLSKVECRAQDRQVTTAEVRSALPRSTCVYAAIEPSLPCCLSFQEAFYTSAEPGSLGLRSV